ncbi:MAG TPA: single-stranded DNA-binding protein [Firmicutes bacterium]|nr:single-stranded DNA-binding protein [Bacillota bacterium]
MLNRIILIGRLTADPALRYTQSGKAVTRFTLAVDRRPRGGQAERETDFIDIVVWEKLGELCANHLGKGRMVAVEGRLQIRSYEAQDGTRRKAAEVVAENVQFLDWPKDGERPAGAGRPQTGSAPEDIADIDVDDDVPF